MPLSALALRAEKPEWIALEMSSFQLHDTPSLKPDVGVLTNLSPDHLDRYKAHERVLRRQGEALRECRCRFRWVVNNDDPESLAMTAKVKGSRYLFSLRAPADAYYDTASLTLKGARGGSHSAIGSCR